MEINVDEIIKKVMRKHGKRPELSPDGIYTLTLNLTESELLTFAQIGMALMKIDRSLSEKMYVATTAAVGLNEEKIEHLAEEIHKEITLACEQTDAAQEN